MVACVKQVLARALVTHAVPHLPLDDVASILATVLPYIKTVHRSSSERGDVTIALVPLARCPTLPPALHTLLSQLLHEGCHQLTQQFLLSMQRITANAAFPISKCVVARRMLVVWLDRKVVFQGVLQQAIMEDGVGCISSGHTSHIIPETEPCITSDLHEIVAQEKEDNNTHDVPRKMTTAIQFENPHGESRLLYGSNNLLEDLEVDIVTADLTNWRRPGLVSDDVTSQRCVTVTKHVAAIILMCGGHVLHKSPSGDHVGNFDKHMSSRKTENPVPASQDENNLKTDSEIERCKEIDLSPGNIGDDYTSCLEIDTDTQIPKFVAENISDVSCCLEEKYTKRLKIFVTNKSFSNGLKNASSSDSSKNNDTQPTTVNASQALLMVGPVIGSKDGKKLRGDWNTEQCWRSMRSELESAGAHKRQDQEEEAKVSRDQWYSTQASSCLTLALLSTSAPTPLTLYTDNSQHYNTKDPAFQLYNYSRVNALLSRFAEMVRQGTVDPLPQSHAVPYHALTQPEEWDLVWECVYQWPHQLTTLARQIEELSRQQNTSHCVSCHLVTRFLHDLCHRWSVYYNRVHILPAVGDERAPVPEHLRPVLYARITLLIAVRNTMNSAYAVLGVVPPSQM